MKRKLAAFDIEIARPLPSGDWMMAPFFGISCVGLMIDGDTGPTIFHPNDGQALPLPGQPYRLEMSDSQIRDIALLLLSLANDGYEIVSWNGLGFDYPAIAKGARDPDVAARLARLALEMYDPGFQQVCKMGYMVKLAKIAEALGVGSKTAGMSGALAPVLWSAVWPEEDAMRPESRQKLDANVAALLARGIQPGTRQAHDLVLEYVGQDARLTLDVYIRMLQVRATKWVTARGTLSRNPWRPTMVQTTQGPRMLKAWEAMGQPVPDTSWMTGGARPREAYYGWTIDALGVEAWEDIVESRPTPFGPSARQILAERAAYPDVPEGPPDWPSQEPPAGDGLL